MASIDTGAVSARTETVIALVRHGQAESNVAHTVGGHTDVGLTAVGRHQAEATARALVASIAPTAVVSSDLARAAQTAEPIGRAAGVAVDLDPRLRERSLGDLDGLSFADVEARHPGVWQRLRARDPTLAPPGGETVAGVFERVSAALADIVTARAGQRVVVVSHGIALYHALSRILGAEDPSRRLGWFTLVDNCSISTVAHVRGDWLLRGVNSTCHLAP